MSRSAKRKNDIDEAALRAKGLVPKTVWVPDVNAPGFVEEYARQVRLVAETDAKDPTIESFMDAAVLENFREIDEMERAAGLNPPSFRAPS